LLNQTQPPFVLIISAYRLSIKVYPQPIVDGFLQILPRSQASFRGLDGRVAELELNLLEAPAGFAAELGAGPPGL
jgi:hypothetical protein